MSDLTLTCPKCLHVNLDAHMWTTKEFDRGCECCGHMFETLADVLADRSRLRAEVERLNRKYDKLVAAVEWFAEEKLSITYEEYDLIGFVVWDRDDEPIVPKAKGENYQAVTAALLAAFDDVHKDGRTEENME